MIVFSLVSSTILLALSIWAVRSWAVPILSFAATYVVVALAPFLCMLGLYPAWIQGFLLILAVGLCSYPKRRPKAVAILGVVITFATYGVVGIVAWQDVAEALAQYPYVSIEERLPVRTQTAVTSDNAVISANDFPEDFFSVRRRTGLQHLHESTFDTFISRPGFGVTRMRDPLQSIANREPNDDPPISQPVFDSGKRLSAAGTDASELRAPQDEPPKFLSMHRGGILSFFDPNGFGYFKDRRHVAGFQPHRFQKLPEPASGYTIQSIDLIGLVVHAEPVVYISDHLPRMDELVKAPKAPPDAFETEGLKELAKGKNLYVRDTPTHTRALGAIRAIEQCTNCHACDRGHLLGAFSYTLKR